MDFKNLIYLVDCDDFFRAVIYYYANTESLTHCISTPAYVKTSVESS